MEHFTREQCRALDAESIARGIPSILLMEHAALGATRILEGALHPVAGRSVWVLCGPGNNGGDGYAIARLLFLLGARVSVWDLVAPQEIDPAGDAGRNRAALIAVGVEPLPAWSSLPETPRADCIVDAIFGTGLSRAPEGHFAAVIRKINDAKAHVLAVDIPSGLDANTGVPLGETVKADITATFGVPKVGFREATARRFTGGVACVPIGIPPDLLPEGVPSSGDFTMLSVTD